MATTVVKAVYETFWSSTFWLPSEYTWEDFESKENGVYYPRVKDIHWALAIAILLIIVRFIYERLLIVPLVSLLGLKVEKKKRYVAPNPVLEEAFTRARGKVALANLENLSKKTELTQREIERWFYKRRLRDAPTAMMRFRECSWHFIFYLSVSIYGIYILWDRSWFWDISYCFRGWPYQHVDTPLYIFYLVEIAFYISLLITSLTDVKRKDFWEMAAHHCITIVLMYCSWATNFVRIGALVAVAHDVSDYWMAAAKMAQYSKKMSLCEVLFAFFIAVWLVSRMAIYPFWILWSVIFEMSEFVPEFTLHTLFVALLCAIQVLNVIWTYLILKIALQKFTNGSLQRDIRSDTESDLSEDCEPEPSKVFTNGNTASPDLRTRNGNTPSPDLRTRNGNTPSPDLRTQNGNTRPNLRTRNNNLRHKN